MWHIRDRYNLCDTLEIERWVQFVWHIRDRYNLCDTLEIETEVHIHSTFCFIALNPSIVVSGICACVCAANMHFRYLTRQKEFYVNNVCIKIWVLHTHYERFVHKDYYTRCVMHPLVYSNHRHEYTLIFYANFLYWVSTINGWCSLPLHMHYYPTLWKTLHSRAIF